MGCSDSPEAIPSGTAQYVATCGAKTIAGAIGRASFPGLPGPDGAAPPNAGDLVSDDSFENEPEEEGEEVEDPGRQYGISCTSSGSDSLQFTGSLSGANDSDLNQFPGSATRLEVSGQLGADGAGSGDVTIITATADGSVTNTEPCTFKAAPAPLEACSTEKCTSGKEPGELGEFYLTFNCASAQEQGNLAGADCTATGTVRMENCTLN